MMAKRVLCAGMLAIVVAAAPALCRANGDGLPVDVVKMIDAEDWKAAAAALEPLAKDTSNERAIYWLGMAHFSTGNTKAALPRFKQSLDLNPDDRTAAVMLVRCAGPQRSMTLIDYAVKLFPLDPEVSYQGGRQWIYRHQSSLDFYRMRPQDRKEWWLNECLDEAIRHFSHAALLDEAHAENHRWLGYALARRGRNEEAVDHLRQAIRHGPMGWEVYAVLGACLTRLGRGEEAAATFADASRLAPNADRTGRKQTVRSTAWFGRGQDLYNTGRYVEAIAALRQTLALQNNFPNVRHWLGLAAFGMEDYILAVWSFKENQEIEGGARSTYWSGRCAHALGRDDLAEPLFKEAIKIVGDRKDLPPAEWRHYLGRTQWALNKQQEALGNLKSAFMGERDNMLYARWYYQASVAADDPYGAIDVCRRIGLRGRPDDAIEGILFVLKKWPTRRMEDFVAGRKTPHTEVAGRVLGEVCMGARRPHTAALYFRQARLTSGVGVRRDAAWALALSGHFTEAQRAFYGYARFYRGTAPDQARIGLGCLYAGLGKWPEADVMLATVQGEAFIPSRDTGRLWAGIHTKNPNARAGADPFTLLGVMHHRLYSADRGIEVLAVAPGSILNGTTPTIRRGDRLVRVGTFRLGTKEQLDALRKSPVPDKPVDAWIWRGDQAFGVMLDYPSAVRELPPPATRPAAETQPGAGSKPATGEGSP